MKSLFNLKIFLIVAFVFRKEAHGGVVTLSDRCSEKVTCQTCVNFENFECYWVTVLDRTSLCVGDLARWGGTFLTAIQGQVNCKPSQFADNINHSGSQVGDNNDSSNHHPTPNDLAKRAESIMIQTQTQMNLTKSFLYKQKTLLSLKFLHSIIPRIQLLEQNMTALVYKHGEENKSSSNENENYKITDKKLDSDLLAIEKDVNQNRKHLTEYMDAYQNIEGEMKFLNDTMQRGFGGSN